MALYKYTLTQNLHIVKLDKTASKWLYRWTDSKTRNTIRWVIFLSTAIYFFLSFFFVFLCFQKMEFKIMCFVYFHIYSLIKFQVQRTSVESGLPLICYLKIRWSLSCTYLPKNWRIGNPLLMNTLKMSQSDLL